MFLLFLLLGVLSWGTQVAFGSLKLSFSNAAECEPVFVSFQGHLNSSFQQVPLFLQILPVNSTPTVIPLPSYTANSTGVNITFLPNIPSNTEFLATLTDPSGDSISSVSDIFEMSAASPANTACLSHTSFTPSFQIENLANISQCQDFTVSYSGDSPPTIELFNPKGTSYPLQLASSTSTTATYTMVAARQSQVMLMFKSDAGGRNQTSPLLTVQGDAFSPQSCLSNLSNQSNSESSSKSNKSPGIAKGTIIGLSVGLGVTFLLTLAMGWYVVRERRRRRRVAKQFDFDANRMERTPSPYVPPVKEKGPPAPPPFFGYPGYTESGYVKDPTYVSEKYSPTISDYPRTSISWEDLPKVASDERDQNFKSDPRASAQMNMLSSSNIEKMLSRASVDVLALHSPRSVRSRNSSFGILPVSPPPALHHTSFGHRQSSDVPHNTSFFAESVFIADQPVPLTESPESMGSRLRPESGIISPPSAGTTEIMHPQKAVLSMQPARSVSPRTASRENSRAKLEGFLGSRRTASNGSRFSMDSSDAGYYGDRL